MTDASVFQRLTADPNDAAGAFAYIAYKRQKVEFCKTFGDRQPGAVLLGYRFSVQLQQNAEKKAGVGGSTISQSPIRTEPARPTDSSTAPNPTIP
ncbi:hypothetical protein JOD97_005175 [Duganella sp. 1411]|uniref:hypothetical protein n=1 Tax=Duganella sp. 1411 TaxID=2806572 RepID=UPI001AE55D3B|nr:hypothetical protein [Duganella sp. 1411]MBP1207096.1 hypothetical protein [Duganella sp. 1411]